MYCIVSKDYSKTWYHALSTLSEARAKLDYLKATGQDPHCQIVTAEQFKEFHLKEI